jgi:hypothetical protein
MKYVKLGVILLGVMLVLGGCEKGVIPESPTPISPDDVWEGNLSFHTFIWESVEDADYYALQVASDEGFANTVFIDSTIQDTIYKVVADSFVTDTLYYWRVAAGNEVGWSEWSKTARFYRGDKEMLISPEDGEVFFREFPIFIWHSYPTAENYVIRVCLESFDVINTVWEDTTSDTTYQLPNNMLWRDYNYTGFYSWAVLVQCKSGSFLWSNPRIFTPRFPPDLDSTYFPLGLEYEWAYERHEEYDDYFDTFTVKVTDSFWVAETLFFQTENYHLDMPNPVKVWSESLSLYFRYEPDSGMSSQDVGHTIQILNPSWSGYLNCREETLNLCIPGSPGPYWYVTRVKGLGLVSQRENRNSLWRINDRLLYFYNGQDTIYKAVGG